MNTPVSQHVCIRVSNRFLYRSLLALEYVGVARASMVLFFIFLVSLKDKVARKTALKENISWIAFLSWCVVFFLSMDPLSDDIIA